VATDLEQYIQPALYDVAYSWHTADIPFWVERAKKANGPVLEVGCGTGRVLIPTLEAGVDAEGIDLHPGMIDVLKEKAKAKGIEARASVADMRDFTMLRRYALITLPFRGFMHLLTTEDQLQALRCMREHLDAGGALVYNLFYPSFERIVEPGDQERIEREFPHPESGLPLVLASVQRTYDRVRQVLRAEMELRESDARGYAGPVHQHRFALRWTYRYEMDLLLRTVGFTRFDVAGGFDGRPFERPEDEMVWTAWKD
jgi:SAM-dependent methyltransferase